MRLLILLVLVTLSLMGALVARDNSYQPSPAPLSGVRDPMEVLQETERGRELKNIVDLTVAGDKEAANKAYEEYRQKYNPPPMGLPSPGSEEPARRQSIPNMGPPMQLPPEAR